MFQDVSGCYEMFQDVSGCFSAILKLLKKGITLNFLFLINKFKILHIHCFMEGRITFSFSPFRGSMSSRFFLFKYVCPYNLDFGMFEIYQNVTIRYILMLICFVEIRFLYVHT